ncbi:hypothetical protein BH10BDE1_BH10BDE1_14000 [soil metagenome]
MNLRLFSIALLISALPLIAQAEAARVTLNHGDFVAAEKLSHDGETLVSVKLSKSGKAKFKKLNSEAVGKTVHSHIGGVASDFILRTALTGDSLEMGPYDKGDAEKVIAEINN